MREQEQERSHEQQQEQGHEHEHERGITITVTRRRTRGVPITSRRSGICRETGLQEANKRDNVHTKDQNQHINK